jgi:hypothetical protein
MMGSGGPWPVALELSLLMAIGYADGSNWGLVIIG